MHIVLWIHLVLYWLRAHLSRALGHGRARVAYVKFSNPAFQLWTEKMNVTLKDDATVTLDVVLKDKFGAVATASGALAVSSSDATIAAGTLSADGSTVTIAAAGAGKLGTATITVSDAADNLSIPVSVTVVAGAPVSIELDSTTAAQDTTTAATTASA